MLSSLVSLKKALDATCSSSLPSEQTLYMHSYLDPVEDDNKNVGGLRQVILGDLFAQPWEEEEATSIQFNFDVTAGKW